MCQFHYMSTNVMLVRQKKKKNIDSILIIEKPNFFLIQTNFLNNTEIKLNILIEKWTKIVF